MKDKEEAPGGGKVKVFARVKQKGDGWQGVYEPEMHTGADGKLRIRLMLDKICYDVFGNDGEAAVQGILYTMSGADGLTLRADGSAKIDLLEVWSMEGN